MGIVISELAAAGKLELINTAHSYTLPISLISSDGMMNESLYTDDDFIFILAVILFIRLICLSPLIHMMSTVVVLSPTIITLHCNING